jgi:PTS system ascorbate-specific IIA component
MTVTGARDGLEAADWPSAVLAAAGLLVDLGAAAESYPDACVSVVAEHGPYIVLAPGLALVHARPECGGLAVGVGVARLVSGVAFGHPDNDPVDLLLALCTPEAAAHLTVVSALARALAEGLAGRLRAAADAPELAAIMKETLADA